MAMGRRRRAAGWTVLLAILVSGCATGRSLTPRDCAAVGAAAGAAAGLGIGAGASDDDAAAPIGLAIGAVTGGLAGYAICLLREPDEPPPETPEVARLEPGPPREPEPQIPTSFVITGVNFGFNEAYLRPEAAGLLKEWVFALRNNPKLRVQVEGHTDAVGALEYNRVLSLQRAKAVKRHLMAEGIEEERVTAVGFGYTKPIADNDTEEGRAKNRRVEIKVLR